MRMSLFRFVSLLVALGTLLATPAVGQRSQVEGVQIESMPTWTSLKRVAGRYSASIKLEKVSGSGEDRYYAALRVSGAELMFPEMLRFEFFDGDRLEQQIDVDVVRPSVEARGGRRRAFQENIDAEARLWEERRFEVSADQLRRLAAAESLEVVIAGDSGSLTRHTIKAKKLKRLAEWIDRFVSESSVLH